MVPEHELPDNVVLVRTTPVFDGDTVPKGLLSKHRIAWGAWGRVLASKGSFTFVFADHPDDPILLKAGDTLVVPPGATHHVSLDGPAEFSIEFYKEPPEGRRRSG